MRKLTELGLGETFTQTSVFIQSKPSGNLAASLN